MGLFTAMWSYTRSGEKITSVVPNSFLKNALATCTCEKRMHMRLNMVERLLLRFWPFVFFFICLLCVPQIYGYIILIRLSTPFKLPCSVTVIRIHISAVLHAYITCMCIGMSNETALWHFEPKPRCSWLSHTLPWLKAYKWVRCSTTDKMSQQLIQFVTFWLWSFQICSFNIKIVGYNGECTWWSQ